MAIVFDFRVSLINVRWISKSNFLLRDLSRRQKLPLHHSYERFSPVFGEVAVIVRIQWYVHAVACDDEKQKWCMHAAPSRLNPQSTKVLIERSSICRIESTISKNSGPTHLFHLSRGSFLSNFKFWKYFWSLNFRKLLRSSSDIFNENACKL